MYIYKYFDFPGIRVEQDICIQCSWRDCKLNSISHVDNKHSTHKA